MPTFKICTILSLSGFSVKAKGISLLNLLFIKYPHTAPTVCPVTVAIAAPAVPIAGINPIPKIKIGSKIKFVTETEVSVIKNNFDFPLAITKRSNTHCPIYPNENIIHMPRYIIP